MLPKVKVVHRPDTPAKAVRLLAAGGKTAAVLAGGTSLALSGRKTLEELVDLSACGLDFVALKAGRLRLGAMTRMATLAAAAEPRAAGAALLTAAAGAVGSTLTRNLATVGGNLCQLFPWCHLPVALTALDAELLLAGAGEKTVPAAAFFEGPPRAVLGPKGILREVRIKALKHRRTAFQRFGRTRADRALVTAAVAFRMRGGSMADVRAVAGGLAPRPQRVSELEAFLEGKKPAPSVFARVRNFVPARLETAADARASRDFKLHVLAVLLERAFAEASGAGGRD